MDWQPIVNAMQALVKDRRGRIFMIGALIATCLVVLQYHQQQQRQPMCELISGCPLRTSDLQRMQLALGQSGFSNYKIDGQRIYVPRDQHANYLQAVADKNALPMDLRDQATAPVGTNPFLSRNQQLAIERAARKSQIRQMILRLPFVDQAWFEMDTASSGSPFKPVQRSAVVSVRPTAGIAISSQHVDTIRRMICGALAGMQPQQIAVIDVNNGFAWHDPVNAGQQMALDSDQELLRQQRNLENRIRVALKRFDGIDVGVQLIPGQWPNKSTATPDPQDRIGRPASANSAANRVLTAGSNGTASICQISVHRDSELQPQTESPPGMGYRISVAIDVPATALDNISLSPAPLVRRVLARQPSNEVEDKFAAAKIEIERAVKTVLPSRLAHSPTANEIRVNLIGRQQPIAADWQDQLQTAFQQYWPSVATLAVGLMLLLVVTRKPGQVTDASNNSNDAVVLPLTQAQSQTPVQQPEAPTLAAAQDMADDGPRARINRLIKSDPDAAAKVIQEWMRDAA